MNRQAKRMMQRRQAAADRQEVVRRQRQVTEQRKGRTGVRQFLREVRQELRKVAWPDRRQMVTYTAVVLVTVAVLTSLVFGLDFVISKGVFRIFGV